MRTMPMIHYSDTITLTRKLIENKYHLSLQKYIQKYWIENFIEKTKKNGFDGILLPISKIPVYTGSTTYKNIFYFPEKAPCKYKHGTNCGYHYSEFELFGSTAWNKKKYAYHWHDQHYYSVRESYSLQTQCHSFDDATKKFIKNILRNIYIYSSNYN